MKKLQSFLFALSICFSFSIVSTGCNNAVINDNTSTSDSVCSNLWSYPECDKPQTCSLCGITSGEILGHTVNSGTCQRCGKTINLWSINNVFNPLTGSFGEKYITTQATGTFLSGTNLLSKLTASIRITAESIFFTLYEQGTYLVMCNTQSTCDISIRNSQNEIYHLLGTMNENSVHIAINDSDISTIIDALKIPGTIRFYLTISSKPSNFYEFSVETNNFAELYREIE